MRIVSRVMESSRWLSAKGRIGESKNSPQGGLLRPSPLFSLSELDRAAEYSHPHGAGAKTLCGELGKGPEKRPRGDAMAGDWSWWPGRVKEPSTPWEAGVREEE